MPNPNGRFLTSFIVLTALSFDAVALTCDAGYYGSASCSKCPSYQTIPGSSAIGTTVITGCYISKNATISDDTGNYEVFASDCYYKQDTGGGGTDTSYYGIRTKLIEILQDQTNNTIDKTILQDDTNLVDFLMRGLGMDSLDIVEMIMAIEEEFGIEIPDEDAQKWGTLRDLIEYIQPKVA